MTDAPDGELATYLHSAESWAVDKARADAKALRIALISAGVLGVVALLEAIALIVLTPLKTVVPYTLLVDRQTGYIEALKPLERQLIAPDAALTRSLLAQYVIAREGFDIDSLRDDYRKVALWSVGEARDRYMASMQASNPASPLATLPRRALIAVTIRGISSLGANTALIRFSTTRTDPGGQPQPAQTWQAVISYRFSSAAMSEADRLINPLGFVVTRYARNAEFVADPTSGPPGAGAPAYAPSAISPAAPNTTMPGAMTPRAAMLPQGTMRRQP